LQDDPGLNKVVVLFEASGAAAAMGVPKGRQSPHRPVGKNALAAAVGEPAGGESALWRHGA